MMSTPPVPAKRRPVLRFLKKRYQGWRTRHQNPFNFAIHLLGIPLAVVGVFILLASILIDNLWYWGLGCFVLGYLFQWVGHLVEGNDVGELIPVKRLLGLPYVAIAPRYQQTARSAG
jgi:uncharacterized membrane protein YGL010W